MMELSIHGRASSLRRKTENRKLRSRHPRNLTFMREVVDDELIAQVERYGEKVAFHVVVLMYARYKGLRANTGAENFYFRDGASKLVDRDH